jgi:linoleoyl-CoA desaturase
MTQKEMETVFCPSSLESIKKLKFAQNTEFQATLNRRVDDFFQLLDSKNETVPKCI